MSHHTVGAAFRSPTRNQCYIFVKKQYVVLDYAPAGEEKVTISGPSDITDGFPCPEGKPFDHGIDCAFDIENINEAFIFAGNKCAKIKHSPRSDAEILLSPIPIADMFPCLEKTPFAHGIDAAIRYRDNWSVILFKDAHSVLLNYDKKICEATEKITRRFGCLYGTVFESGIDAAFTSHINRQFYIFKGERCARIDYASNSHHGDFIFGNRIKPISEEWPAIHEMFEEEN